MNTDRHGIDHFREFKKMKRLSVQLLGMMLMCGFGHAAWAGDIQGGKDHPLNGTRMPNQACMQSALHGED